MTSREIARAGRCRARPRSPRRSSPWRRAGCVGVVARRGAAVVTAGAALALAAVALADAGSPARRRWVVVDAAGGLLVGVIGVVGLASVLVSPAYLATARDSLVAERRARDRDVLRRCSSRSGRSCSPFRSPATSAPPGSRRGDDRRIGAARRLQRPAARARGRLEVPDPHLARSRGRAARDRPARRGRAAAAGSSALTWRALADVLDSAAAPRSSPTCCCSPASRPRSAGRRCTTGCPTRTRRRRRPVSALLSAALLPAVLLVAWRSRAGARARRSACRTAAGVLVAFGLVSLAVAVPFLWRSLAWKRLLAYSSLEHMGVIALGIGFGTPLALAGVAVHIVGHAVAKALGFYAATPLLGHEPRAAAHAVDRDRPHAARARRRRSASRSARSPGCRRRRSSSARC